MITDQDVTKLKKTFATKVALAKTERKVDALQEQVGDLTVEVGEVKEKLNSLDSKVDRIVDTLDLMTGYIHDLRNENRFGSLILNRHERQIEALAAHTGATIPLD